MSEKKSVLEDTVKTTLLADPKFKNEEHLPSVSFFCLLMPKSLSLSSNHIGFTNETLFSSGTAESSESSAAGSNHGAMRTEAESSETSHSVIECPGSVQARLMKICPQGKITFSCMYQAPVVYHTIASNKQQPQQNFRLVTIFLYFLSTFKTFLRFGKLL